MSYYKNHMFICTNQKDNGKQCCANNNANAILAYAKQQAAALGLSKESRFRISSTGCMGRCAQGPVLAIYPQGTWYTGVPSCWGKESFRLLNQLTQCLTF